MNDFALNGAEINGQDYAIALLEGYSEVLFDAAQEGIRGAMLASDADISLEAPGDINAGIMASGSLDVDLEAELSPVLLTMIRGDIAVSADASMTGAAGIRGEGSMSVLMDDWLYLTRRAMGRGFIPVEVDFYGDARIAQRVFFEGNAGIVIGPAYLDGWRRQAVRPGMTAVIGANVAGPAALRMSGGGFAAFDLIAEAAVANGQQVGIEGGSVIETAVRGDIRMFRYVRLEGSADMEVSMSVSRFSEPLPTEYIPAPKSRRFIVSKEKREFRLPKKVPRRL